MLRKGWVLGTLYVFLEFEVFQEKIVIHGHEKCVKSSPRFDSMVEKSIFQQNFDAEESKKKGVAGSNIACARHPHHPSPSPNRPRDPYIVPLKFNPFSSYSSFFLLLFFTLSFSRNHSRLRTFPAAWRWRTSLMHETLISFDMRVAAVKVPWVGNVSAGFRSSLDFSSLTVTWLDMHVRSDMRKQKLANMHTVAQTLTFIYKSTYSLKHIHRGIRTRARSNKRNNQH